MELKSYIEKLVEYLRDDSKYVLSLSHTDLDGYGSQFVLKNTTPSANLIYKNADDGYLMDALDEFTVENDLNEDYMIVITDLNINKECEAKLFEIKGRYGIDTIIFDHHVTGKKIADQHSWYHLDTTICGTQITQNMLEPYFKNLKDIADISDFINTYDMWIKSDETKHNKVSLVSNLVFDNYFQVQSIKRRYIFSVISKISNFLLSGKTTLEAEVEHVQMMHNFLCNFGDIYNLEYMSDENIPTSTRCVLTTLAHFGEYLEFDINLPWGHVYVYTGISSKTSQYCFDYMFKDPKLTNSIFVKYDPEKGGMSVRSKNDNAVEVAKLFGGGGHPPAAGAYVDPELGMNHIIKTLNNI